jgi:hypothetical protein
MQGSGVLFNLNFNVVGSPGTSGPLGFDAFIYNENNPCTNTAGGSVTVTGTVSGTVTYANPTAAGTPPLVSNVLMSGAGSPNVSTMTAPPGPTAGTYALSGFGLGGYTVTPSKSGGQNGAISAFDSARIAQHVTAVSFLTGAALTAADVTGNGLVQSFDAAKIAQYVAGVPQNSQAGMWKFVPVSRSYASVSSNITGQDYSALLMGEVSGNWQNSGTVAANRGQLAEAAGGEEAEIVVDLPTMTAKDGEVVIPVNVQGLTGKGIIAYEVDVRYDPAVIQPAANPVELAGTVSRGLTAVTNANEPGLLRIVVYGSMPIDGDGVLVNLRFAAVGRAGSVSPMTVERIMFNEGEPRVTVAVGSVELF